MDKDNPTQVRRALQQLGIELIAAYSPEARGRSERMFGTLQKRLPQELRLAGISGIEEANRFLKEVYLPQHNARFQVTPEAQGSAFVLRGRAWRHPLHPALQRQHRRYRGLPAAPARPPPPPLRQGHGQGAEYPDGTLAIFHGPRCLARYRTTGEPIDNQTRQAA